MWVAAASSKFGSGLLADRRAADDAEQQRRREAASLRARAEAAARQREEAAAARRAQEAADEEFARQLQREEELRHAPPPPPHLAAAFARGGRHATWRRAEEEAVDFGIPLPARRSSSPIVVDSDDEEPRPLRERARLIGGRDRPQRRDSFIVPDSSDDSGSDGEWGSRRRRRHPRETPPRAPRTRERDTPRRRHAGDENDSPQQHAAAAPSGAEKAVATVLQGVRDHRADELAPKPRDLAVPSLYPYQQAALAWMLRRERAAVTAASSSSSSSASASSSGAHDLVLGGLLADEQGMGKTVQVLALCAAHPPSLAEAPVGGMRADGRAALGTLVVCPLVLCEQWAAEVRSKLPRGGRTAVCVHHGAKRETSAAKLAGYDVVVTTYETVRVEHARGSRHRALFGLKWWRVVLDEAHVVRNRNTAVSKAVCDLERRHSWCLSGTPIQNKLDDLYALLRFLRYPEFGADYKVFEEMLKAAERSAAVRGKKRAAQQHGSEGERLHAILRSVMIRRCKADTFGGQAILPLPPKTITVVARPFDAEGQRVYAALEASAHLALERLEEMDGLQANYMHALALLTRLRQACDSPLLVRGAFADPTKAADDEPPTAAATAKAESLVKGEAEDCAVCMDTIQLETGAVTACGHAYCHDCIIEVVSKEEHANNGKARCPLCREDLMAKQCFPMRRLVPDAFAAVDAAAVDAAADAGAADAAPPPSTKMGMVVEALREMGEDQSDRAIVFSSYVSFLSILGDHLEGAEGMACARVRGGQSKTERERELAKFRSGEVRVLLMSLKCGVGLNLTCANHVILCEPWWNPFAEEQAMDRAHRIGQTRPVRVVRLAISNTVEERVMKLQEDKRAAAAAALGGGGAASQRGLNRLSERDLRTLFGL